jgi:hypothetical protein
MRDSLIASLDLKWSRPTRRVPFDIIHVMLALIRESPMVVKYQLLIHKWKTEPKQGKIHDPVRTLIVRGAVASAQGAGPGPEAPYADASVAKSLSEWMTVSVSSL